MSNAVRQVVSGQIQSFGRGLIKNVAGGIKDMIGGVGDNSPGAALQNKSKFHTKNLQYPLNVEGDPMQGHYILFGINQFNGETKLATARSKSMKKIVDGIEKNMGLSKANVARTGGRTGGGRTIDVATKVGGVAIDSPSGAVPIKDTGQGKPAVGGAKGGNLYAMQKSMKRLDTSIALYMPASVSSNYSFNYADTEIGIFSEAISQMAEMLTKGFKEGFSSIEGSKGNKLLKTGEEAVKRGALKMIDSVAPGVRARAQIENGKILSNRMELSFQGVNRREFSFTFVFMPKSEQEAQVVQQIVHLFKFHSHGAFGTNQMGARGAVPNSPDDEGMGYEMTIPDTFDIQYMYQGSQNTFLNKISTCFCNGVSVQYGGDRYVAYNPAQSLHGDTSPPPQRTTLTLSFKEMEILDRTRIDQGY